MNKSMGTIVTLSLLVVIETQSSGQKVRTTDPGLLGPRIISPRVTAKRSVTLVAIPDSMIQLETRPRWAVTRQPNDRPGAINPGPGGALYISRMKSALRGDTCGEAFTDRIDLTSIRRHGFSLTSVRHEQLTSPVGGFPGGIDEQVTGLGSDGKRLVSQDRLADYVFIRTQAIVYSVKPSSKGLPSHFPTLCGSAYRLHITVEGPADTNPISGQKMRSPSVVN